MLSAGRWGKLAYNQIQDDGRPQHGVPKLLKRVFLVFVYESGNAVVEDSLVSVALAVPPTGEVQPAVAHATAVLEEHLVKVRVMGYPLEPLTGYLFVRDTEVGSLAQHVLRAPYTSHRTVQRLAAEAAGDADGLAVVLAQRLQHFTAQVPHGQHLLIAGLVVDAEPLGGDTLSELTQCKVF